MDPASNSMMKMTFNNNIATLQTCYRLWVFVVVFHGLQALPPDQDFCFIA